MWVVVVWEPGGSDPPPWLPDSAFSQRHNLIESVVIDHALQRPRVLCVGSAQFGYDVHEDLAVGGIGSVSFPSQGGRRESVRDVRMRPISGRIRPQWSEHARPLARETMTTSPTADILLVDERVLEQPGGNVSAAARRLGKKG